MSKFWSFPKAPKDASLIPTDKQITTAPGVYDADYEKIKRANPMWSFSKQTKPKNQLSDSPGPGDYESVGKVSVRAPAYSIQGKPISEMRDSFPGPGSYEPKPVNLKNQPKFTFSSKIGANGVTEKPGPAPGDYEPKIDAVKPSAIKINFSREKRSGDPNRSYNVGPGDYEIKDVKITTGGFMSFVKKGLNSDVNPAPGPGAYDVNLSSLNSKRNVAPFLLSRYQGPQLDKKTPGPGEYTPNIHVVKTRSTSCKFTKSMRVEVLKTETPGVGAYELNDSFTKKNSPGWKFTTFEAFSGVQKTDSPGPGAYENKSIIGQDKPHYSFRRRVSLPKPCDTPAPGKYDPKFGFVSVKANQTLASIFGKNIRFAKTQAENVPGPGIYESNVPKSNISVVFGKAKKDKSDADKAKIPGPGNYEIKGEFELSVKLKKGFSIRLRNRSAHQSCMTPGPGTYKVIYQSFTKKPKSIKIGKELRFKTEDSRDGRDCKPAPGQYDPFAVSSKKNVIIEKDSRFKELQSDSPAPDQYDPKLPTKSIMYTMRPRALLSTLNNTPGPGQYNLKMDALKPNSQKCKFDKSFRSENVNDSSLVGPAQYNVTEKIKGPFFSFGKNKKNKAVESDVPGPGEYMIKSALNDIPRYIKSGLKNRLEY